VEEYGYFRLHNKGLAQLGSVSSSLSF